MMLNIRFGPVVAPLPRMRWLQDILSACLRLQQAPPNCDADVLICTDADMRRYNLDSRGIDRPTDVLSFPALCFAQGSVLQDDPQAVASAFEPDRQAYFLGDIILSIDRVLEQAQAYRHPPAREMGFLLAHGLLHLCGYDHQNDEEETIMNEKTNDILRAANAAGQIDDDELLVLAKQARQHSYSPYSHFAVGACLLGRDGRVFCGCNVENAAYGLTNCAERSALFTAVSEGCREFEAIAVSAEGAVPWPCGACRQALSEFAPRLRVIVAQDGSPAQVEPINKLLAHSFQLPDEAAGQEQT